MLRDYLQGKLVLSAQADAHLARLAALQLVGKGDKNPPSEYVRAQLPAFPIIPYPSSALTLEPVLQPMAPNKVKATCPFHPTPGSLMCMGPHLVIWHQLPAQLCTRRSVPMGGTKPGYIS